MTFKKNTTFRLGLIALFIVGAASRLVCRAYESRHRIPPEPGWRNKDPKAADELLNIALRDSMAASDPPAIVQPNVDRKTDTD